MWLDELSPAERSALKLDGEIWTLAQYAIPVDSPDVLAERVRVARSRAPERFILSGLSAAWAWRAVDTPPLEPEFCQMQSVRGTDRCDEFRSARYLRLLPGDVVETPAGSVLSPWRTLLHVLRWTARDEVAVRLLELADESVSSADARIQREFAWNQRAHYLNPLRRL